MSAMGDTNNGADRLARIRTCLEDWREVVIRADSFLGWEQDWYPVVTGGLLTASFLFVWYWDPTLLTFVSVMGLLVTLADYFGPGLVEKVFGADKWNGAKEKKFEQVCQDICSASEKFQTGVNSCKQARDRKPVVHFAVTVASLLLLGWLGNRINNYFLVYLLTLAVAMLPGLQRRGILKKHLSPIGQKLAGLLNGKEDVKKSE